MPAKLSLILLHEQMLNKRAAMVTTSLTLLDIHDISRSARTYGLHRFYIAHPSPPMRIIAQTLRDHWQSGWGATYNPNRREALSIMEVASSLDEVVYKIQTEEGCPPHLIATSARADGQRLGFGALRETLKQSSEHYLLMLGTGWGMSPQLLERAEACLEPIDCGGDYNHLSVRSAAAIMLDRLLG